MLQKIKDFFFPSIDKEVLEDLDKNSLNSMHILSIFIIAFEVITMILFLVTRKQFDTETYISIGGVLFGVLVCAVILILTGSARKSNNVQHRKVTLFEVLLVLVLSIWAIWVSWRHYPNDDQLLTFFIVQLMIVCFLPLRPWISTLLTIMIYGGLYAVLYSIDKAASLNSFNYIMLVLVTIVGMIVRFYSQKKLSEKTVLLQKKNKELDFASHYDALTRLKNRLALNEDAASLAGRHIFVFMIDIDYFKTFNDTYGHSAGDTVLEATARQLEILYPDCSCYRYGGDEFVVISTKEEMDLAEYQYFTVPSVCDQKICLCIGAEEGTPENYDQVFRLINNADRKLYDLKRKTHGDQKEALF